MLSGTAHTIKIRNVFVDISPTAIKNALGLPTPPKGAIKKFNDFKAGFTLDFMASKLCSKAPKEKVEGSHLTSASLSEWNKIMGFLVRSLVYPTSQTSKFPLKKCALMYALSVPSVFIPVEHFVYFNVHEAAVAHQEFVNSSLVFPSILTLILRKNDVSCYPSDEWSAPVLTITLAGIRKSVGQTSDYVEPLFATLLRMHMDERIDALHNKMGGYFQVIEEQLGRVLHAIDVAAAGPSDSNHDLSEEDDPSEEAH